MALITKKLSQSVFHVNADDTINEQTLAEEELSLKKPNRGPCWSECCQILLPYYHMWKHCLHLLVKTAAKTVPQV